MSNLFEISKRGGDYRNKPSSECGSRNQGGDVSCPSEIIPLIPNISDTKWRNEHLRIRCTRNCVTDRSHFNIWRGTYSRVLIDFYNMIVSKTKVNIPFEDFVNFSYSQSSGYVSPYI
jgi:hypothetical protein